MNAGAPLELARGGSLPNRLAKAAMSEQLAEPEGLPGPALERLYARWSAGGAGLLVTGNVMIDPAHLGEPGNVVLDDVTPLEPFARWADAARSGGARVWMQINHPGRQAPRSLVREPVAPSDVPLRVPGGAFARPRPLTANEVEAVLDRFASTAARAQQAGFDGVQLHAAHGYLISQFLSASANTRTDRWGGDARRRSAFLLEAVRRVQSATRPPFAVGVKLNSADFQRGGFTADESVEVARSLQDLGIDLLEISGGTYEKAAMFAAAGTSAREAFFLEHASRLARELTLPLMLTGGVRSMAGVQQALDEGVAVVGMARPLALEPDLPRRMLSGEVARAQTVDLSTGIRALDGFAEVVWYEQQLARMGRGEPPEPRQSRWTSIARYALGHLRHGRLRGGAS